MKVKEIQDAYISYFVDKGHAQVANSRLVPDNDPTTLFINSGMQPLVSFLMGEPHPQGKRLVNVQNCLRGQGVFDDVEEVGDNRHMTFFRMLGNWSLGDYFKKEQLPWLFTFLTKTLQIPAERLYVSVFGGSQDIPEDSESRVIWEELFQSVGIDPKDRIFSYGVEKNWWSRAGSPEKMPVGEIGGPDSEVFFDFQTPHDNAYGETCHINCDCGRYLEIGNSVFMQYRKTEGGFVLLPQQNVDFGAGLERILAAKEQEPDVFHTSLFAPIIKAIEQQTGKTYAEHFRRMRIIADHLISSSFIVSQDITPSNTEQGYILRRLLRRALDGFYSLGGSDIRPILETIVTQYQETDPLLSQEFEKIQYTILTEEQMYQQTRTKALHYIHKKYPELKDAGNKDITADDAFVLYTTHGLSPTQIKNLGLAFDTKVFAEKMKEHKALSRGGAEKKFAGGLADHEELTIKGHTATHLLQQALRDILGESVHQTGSNITIKRLRFDFNYDQKLTDEQVKTLETIVRGKIQDNLPVFFQMMPVKTAQELGAIGLFTQKYDEMVKVYFMGGSEENPKDAYSKEFCGGPHVRFTGEIKSFTIIKQENLGNKQRRLYAVVE